MTSESVFFQFFQVIYGYKILRQIQQIDFITKEI